MRDGVGSSDIIVTGAGWDAHLFVPILSTTRVNPIDA